MGASARPHASSTGSATAADVAYAALWLASDEAAWVTGLAVNVDGGDAVFAESPRRRRAVEARLA